MALRGGPAPWLPADRDCFEDWYVTDGSAALDPLNHGAVNGPCKSPHDGLAALAEGGAGGLYRLRAGAAGLAAARHAVWFAKPAAMSYAELDALVAPLAARPSVGFWARQMVLGPTPELCLMSPGPIRLPASVAGLERMLDPVWSRP